MLLVYPPLEVGPYYALGEVEVLWQDLSGQSPLDLLGGSPLEQDVCYIAPWKMAELEAGE